MKKVEHFFTRYKGLFVFLFSFLFLTGFLLCVFKSDLFNVREERADSYRYYDDSTYHTDPTTLIPGNVLEQHFTASPDTYRFLEISFASLEKPNAGTFDVHLTGSNVDQQWSVDCSTIPESSYTQLPFTEPITFDEATPLTITIRSHAQSDTLAPSIFLYPNLLAEGEEDYTIGRALFVNGTPINETICFFMVTAQKQFAIVPFLCVAAFVLIGFAALYFFRKKIKIEAFALMITLGLGLVYNFVYTPMSVPDEVCHSLSAYHYSNLMTFHFDDSNEIIYMRKDDADLLHHSSKAISTHNYVMESENFHWIATDTDRIPVSIDDASSYITTRDLAYVAPAIGITIGRILHLGAYPTYYLGRIGNLIFLSLCMYFAMKRMPYGKVALAAITLLPMTMHLASSYSYDCYTIGLCMLLFAQMLWLMNLDRAYSIKDLVCTCILILFAIPYKVAYIGIAFMALMLPRKNFKSKQQHIFWKVLLISAGVFGIVLMEFPRIIGILTSASSTVTADAAASTAEYYTAGVLVQHPFSAVMMFLRTLRSLGSWYYTTMIGLLPGWFQIAVPSFYLVPFSVILLLAFTKTEHEPNSIGTMKKWYLVVLSVMMMGLVMLALLFSWTPIESTVIYGIQGRYFIPILPVIFLIIRNNTLVLKKNMDHALILASLFFNVMVLANVFSQVFTL